MTQTLTSDYAGMNGSLPEAGWTESTRPINGLDLHMVEAGESGNPLLILLHGFPAFWWTWRNQITPLASAGFHVVVPDMRGYNLSAAPERAEDYTLDILAADVVAIADAFGAPCFNLVGHDWGSIIGWWVAARYPERVNRTVQLAGLHPDIWATQQNLSIIRRPDYVDFFQLPWLPEISLSVFGFCGMKSLVKPSTLPDTFGPGELERYVEAWARPDSLKGMLNYYRAFRQRKMPATPAPVLPPTLYLCGSRDVLLPPTVTGACMALCRDGKFERVEGASHWPHLDQPEYITSKILSWLQPGMA